MQNSGNIIRLNEYYTDEFEVVKRFGDKAPAIIYYEGNKVIVKIVENDGGYEIMTISAKYENGAIAGLLLRLVYADKDGSSIIVGLNEKVLEKILEEDNQLMDLAMELLLSI